MSGQSLDYDPIGTPSLAEADPLVRGCPMQITRGNGRRACHRAEARCRSADGRRPASLRIANLAQPCRSSEDREGAERQNPPSFGSWNLGEHPPGRARPHALTSVDGRLRSRAPTSVQVNSNHRVDSNAHFTSTNWQLFVALKDSDPEGANAALGELCRIYVPPLYAFARRKGIPPADAQDLVQGLLSRLLERDAFRSYAPTPGARFRTWLITCLKRYELDEWRRGQSRKRGGGMDCVSLDREDDDGHPLLEVPDSSTPESAFDAAVAKTVTRIAFRRLEQEYAAAGLGEIYQALAPMILAPDLPGKMDRYRLLAQRVGMTVASLTKRKERLVKQFGTILRQEVRRLVETEEEVEAELRHLIGALA